MRSVFLFVFALLLAVPVAHAQTAATSSTDETVITEKAKVVSVLSSEIKNVPGTDTSENYQTLSAEVLSGPDTGKIVTVENDYLALTEGEVFFMTHQTAGSTDGYDQYAVSEPDRLPALGMLIAIFIIAVGLIGGFTGIRGLIALALSFFFILYALLPGILSGYDPTLVAVGVASVIILVGSYLTHGINLTTTAAVLGMVATIGITAIIAYVAIHGTQLTGFNDENAVYLNFSTKGHIDFVGLLLGGMLIGILGILYDAAISQAVAVEELLRAMPDASKWKIFSRAMRIGREHIGALVNTLALAYAGASLPLLLLFRSYADEPFLQTVNRELFATEIVRACVGSIGIVIAVPIATLVAIYLLRNFRLDAKTEASHSHSHGAA